MDRDPVAVARSQDGQEVFLIFGPIAVRVAVIGGLGVPGCDRAGDDLVDLVTGHGLDGGAALAVAVCVQARQDHFTRLHQARGVLAAVVLDAGALHGEVHLVADDPDVAAPRVADEVRAAPGEIGVAAGVRDSALGFVAVIEPDQNAEALVGPTAVVAAACVVGIAAQLFSEEDPAEELLFSSRGRRQDGLAAGVVKAVEIWGIVQQSRHLFPPACMLRHVCSGMYAPACMPPT
ncbi:MAG: hypothetical protein CVU38_13510 [Chloroflexi bacterium HGW-Chloroflexi-1]|nr:MAG: hypothetical protein CVU38_13510 [Chloroflexi bacterium HGW-Chloroflexi-1]